MTYVVDTNGILRAKFTPGDNPLTEKSLADSVLPLAHFEQESRKIAQRENRCIGGTVTPRTV